jgi:sugar/nucleoside kinase (ribokinase family)
MYGEEIMDGIWTMGELLVEIMRPRPDMGFTEIGEFLGPFPSGAPAIFIDTVARLGHNAGIIGGIGNDDFGFCVRDRLIRDGVDCSLVEVFPQGTTAVAFVTYFRDGSRKFIYHFDNTPAVLPRFKTESVTAVPKFFHVMGCSVTANRDFGVSILEAAKHLTDQGASITFDPNIRPELMDEESLENSIRPLLDICTILLPGTTELMLVSGCTSIESAVDSLFTSEKLEMIVLKRGKEGCTVHTREGATDVPAYTVDEVDPTGAGDCFDAGFLCGLIEEKSPEDCGKIAAVAGALNAGVFGPMEGDISRETVDKIVQSLSSY